MPDAAVQRRLAAIMSADVVGYSRLMGIDEAGTLAALQVHRRELIDPEIEKHSGRLVKLMGDGALTEFGSIVQATECAVAIQRGMAERNADVPQDRRIEFRIGLNFGDVIIDGDDIYGDGVNVAARLEGLAEPGGVCVSEAVRSAVGTRLPFDFAFMGERVVKNIAEPIRVYQVIAAVKDNASPACPYPGMVPFAARDADHFYGRADQIERMIQLLRHQRFMMVIGPSGSGKSSLVHAGLLPALTQSRAFAPYHWLIRTMRPGAHPTLALAELFGNGDTGVEFGPGTIDDLLAAHPPAERLLLLVDQFEETFTQADRAEQARFIAALQAFRIPDNCALILTLRADFYPDLMTSYLWPVDASQRVEVAPLRGEALREAIVRPAADVGVRIENGLVDRLLADAADEPGALPLLQETMSLLWDGKTGRTLSLDAYERLSRVSGDGAVTGGLAVAIALKADATMAKLDLDQQVIARRIFLRLIQFGEGRADTRRQQPVASLHATNDPAGAFDHTLEHLTRNRLLTRSGGKDGHPPAVDISHESLISSWSRVQDWVDERREAEQIRRRLETKASEWVRLGQGAGGLLDEAELPEAERWLASPDAADLGYDATLPALVKASQNAIVQAEQARQDAQRRELAQAQTLAATQARAATRLRRSAIGLAAVFLVAVGAAVFAWMQSQEARQAEREATRLAEAEAAARTDADARRAESELARIEAENARLASIAQLLSIQAPQQQAALLDERAALLARQAHHFSTAGSRGLKIQIDRTLREVVGKPNFSPMLWPFADAVTLSPDGSRLASATMDGADVLLWDLTTPGAEPTLLPGYPGPLGVSGIPATKIYAIAFSPDGKALLAANAEGSIGRWNLERPEAAFEELPRQEGGVWSVAYSPDGHWLALGSKLDDSFALWDLRESKSILVADPEPAVAGSGPSMSTLAGVPVAFSSDSTTLATGSLNGIIRIWQLDDWSQPVASIRGHDGALSALVFYDADRRLASSGLDGTVRLWDLEDLSAPPVTLQGGIGPVSWIDLDRAGATLAAASPSDGIRLWQLDQPDLPPHFIPADNVFRVALSSDGNQLASAAASRGLRLWDLEPSGRPQVLTDHEGGVVDFTFSSDMTQMISGSGDGTIRFWRWDDLDTPPVVLAAEKDAAVNSVSISADGGRLLSASWNGNSIQFWDLTQSPDASMRLPLQVGADPWDVRFGPSELEVAATTTFGAYRWRMNDLNAEPELLVQTGDWATELAFSPSGDHLAVAALVPQLYLKELARPDAPVQELYGHGQRGAWSVVFSPDGEMLVTGGRDGTIRLWDPSNPNSSSIILGRHDDMVRRVRFSPDGEQLGSAGDHTVRLWDPSNLDAVPTVLSGHEGEVLGLEYSPDGRYLVSGSRDDTIRIWDLAHPLNASTNDEIADLACTKVRRNLTIDEWHRFIGPELPYERTCPNLPIHPSLFESAGKLAQEVDIPGAVALLTRATELDPDLNFSPQQEAERLAAAGE